MLFTRAHLPASIRAIVRETSSHKVLAWTHIGASLPASEYLVATSDSLISAKNRPSSPRDSSRALSWPWEVIDRAAWDPTASTLTVTFTTAEPPLVAIMPTQTPVRFLTTIRERIEHSVVMSETVALKDGNIARVALRRPFDGDLFIEVVYDTPHHELNEKDQRKVRDVVTRFHDLSGAPLKTC